MELFNRHIQPLIEETLTWARVIMLHGARQSGKTTASSIGGRDRGHCRWFGLIASGGVCGACC